ncbi:hypothetical protein [Streptomyces sp. NBC_01565]|uniref:hypothetical protein n=1 Tax=Streptomyces sp. NBC_01565 TaxID=2975881 RepID=UPI00224D842C|nr:hypothetical protein [Streptomyces sp. NBC_01565]MCX4546655.1 hypothetical protein [Streptomyces sp. NBC_01565]
MAVLYTVADGDGNFPMDHLGYAAGGDDLIVAAVHSKLNQFTRDEAISMKVWGWKPDALRDEDRYRIRELIRMYLYQEDRILAALRRLDSDLAGMWDSSTEAKKRIKAFTDSLAEGAQQRRQVVYEQWQKEREAARAKAEADHPGLGDLLGSGLGGDRLPELPSMPATLGGGGLTSADGEELDGIEYATCPGSAPIIDLYDPEVARNIGYVASLARGGMSFSCEYWRLTDTSYDAKRIPDAALRDLVDLVLAVQAEYQLQSLLLDREFDRVIDTRGQEFEYLLAKAAAEAAAAEGSSFWEIFGDVLGIVSAVAGVLAMIPVLTPLAGPIALVAAAGSLAAHTVDAAIKGDWDAETIAGLATDVLGALPVIGAVGKAAKAGKLAMKSVGKVSVAIRSGGRAFLSAAGSATADAGKISGYLGTKGAKFVGASATKGVLAGRVIQGSASLITQVPTVVKLTSGTEAGGNAATAVDFTQGMADNAGDWIEMGSRLAKKGGGVSLSRFAAAFT